MEKKKYSVYRSKDIIYKDLSACLNQRPRRLFFVFVNYDDDVHSEYEKSLIYPIECIYNIRFIGNSCCNCEPPSPSFMEKLEYYGEVDSIYEIDFNT